MLDFGEQILYHSSMELKKCIEERYSCRFFKKRKKVDDELVLDIIQTAITAPSAKNRQPWKFAVATGKLKDQIVLMMKKKACGEAGVNLKEYERVNWDSNSSVANTARAMGEAPVLILIFKKIEQNWNIGDNLSIGACIENMCLRATDLGLASLWFRDTYAIEDEVCEMMKSKNLFLVSSLAIGYPQNKRTYSHRKSFGKNFVQFKKQENNSYHKKLFELNRKTQEGFKNLKN